MEEFEIYTICRIAGVKKEYIEEIIAFAQVKVFDSKSLYEYIILNYRDDKHYDPKVPKREYEVFKKGLNRLEELKASKNYKIYWKDYLGDILKEEIPIKWI